MTDKPVWLQERPDILKLLYGFIDKLNKRPLEQWTQPPTIPVNERILPVLFVQGGRADQSWALLKSLDQDYRVLDIRLNKSAILWTPNISMPVSVCGTGRRMFCVPGWADSMKHRSCSNSATPCWRCARGFPEIRPSCLPALSV